MSIMLLACAALISPICKSSTVFRAIEDRPIRASYLITVADDFIVDIYHNGRAVPDSKRQMIEERYGATAERINIEVRKGDWLVFNVVNNRLRWGGAAYSAVSGCFAQNEFGFTSSLEDGHWSACDTPHDVDKFVTHRDYLTHQPARPISFVWADGNALMQQFAGDQWKGTSLWGNNRNTWIKVIVD